MIESVFYNVGIYCRLSLDDGSVGESGSIQTQKMMLEKYCKDNHYTVKEVYIDDGVDTLLDNNDIAPFKNILNDMYAKDLSRKVKSAKRQRTLNWLLISAQVPYGFIKDIINKYR